MLAPNRFSILLSAALAVASPFVGGMLGWGYVDERSHGLGYLLLYWPVILVHELPARVTDALMASGFVILLMYFGAYLLLCQLARTLWRRIR
jgi:hypothetical protein